MKRTPRLLLSAALVAALLALPPAQAATPIPVWTEAQACTANTCARAAPTLATQGTSIGLAEAYRVTACAASGQTLAGAGSLQAWLYDPIAAQWARNPALDLPLAGITGVRCAAWPDVLVAVRLARHRVLYAASGVTVSGGAAVDVRIHPYSSL